MLRRCDLFNELRAADLDVRIHRAGLGDVGILYTELLRHFCRVRALILPVAIPLADVYQDLSAFGEAANVSTERLGRLFRQL